MASLLWHGYGGQGLLWQATTERRPPETRNNATDVSSGLNSVEGVRG